MQNPEIFSSRRENFLSMLEGFAAIIPAAPLVRHHADCEYPFRQNSDFWYLTGFDEPDAIAVFLPFKPVGERYLLFVQPTDPASEVWTGFRWGELGAVSNFMADKAHSLDEFPKLIGEYLADAEGIAYRVGRHDPSIEKIVLRTWSQRLDKAEKGRSTTIPLIAPCPFLHRMRLVKEKFELERVREASRISSEAHEIARFATFPGMNEREIQGLIEKHFLKEGARGPAYGSIIAGGDNACVLHYMANKAKLRDGDLLLIDAGCSLFDYYNGDITRTFPINGKFSSEQKALYEIVLAAQESGINSAIPGKSAEDIHNAALIVLVEGLVELGLLRGNPHSIIEQGAYQHIYMHRTGHWLGLDVHDVGASRLGEATIMLEEGMVLTVEPGIYLSDRLEIPPDQPQIEDKWKGIGIRIEDNVAITNSEPEILTKGALKSVKAMER